jgi:hypothetical protein
MMIIVIYRDRILLDPLSPNWERYRYFKWWLLPHGVAGALALFLGLSQFSVQTKNLVGFVNVELA